MENKMQKEITLAHGNGGKLMHELIELIRGELSNEILNELSDAAELKTKGRRLAFSTDSYVIKPLFFSGGDIGKLSICGTVNDISMKGARPLYLSLGLIIEEGFSFLDLQKIIRSIKNEAKKAKVFVVTGDVKVVERGAADKLFINTAGVGIIDYPKKIGPRAKKGDAIVINGTIAEHGMAILNARENLGFASKIKSDCASLNVIVQKCLKASASISMMRDLTRGGLATVLHEIAHASNLGIEVYDEDIPIKREVRNMCNILGFDPLYVANEGKFVCFVSKKDAAKIKKAMGKGAEIIGEVSSKHKSEVYLKTKLGVNRILPVLEHDQLPRIC